MNFVYPLGLLGLIGVPIVIIIYILKNKFNEKTVASTYIWNLSDKFMKRKNPFNLINGLLSLILQILVIVTMSFSLAHPTFNIKGSAENNLYILDASASMNFTSDGKTRFDLAKDAIKEKVADASGGSKFSYIYAGEQSKMMVESSTNKDDVYSALESSELTTYSFSIDEAISIAQSSFNDDPSLNVYLFTDKSYLDYKNVEIVDVSNREENYSILDVTYKYVDGKLNVNTTDISYKSTTTLNFDLYVDGEKIATKSTEMPGNNTANVDFETELTSFKEIKVVIEQNDDLPLDNEYIIYNNEEETDVNVLLVSDSPFYVESALKSISNVNYTVIPFANYSDQSGYGLYIFDTCSPDHLPDDGSIFIIGSEGNIPGAGFTMQDKVILDAAGELLYVKDTSNTYKEITANTIGSHIYVGQYNTYNLISDFTTILSCDDNPMVFVGTTPNNYKEIVFSFDLHKSNFPLLYDYAVLMKNLIDFTSLSMIDEAVFTCGDTISVNVLPHTESLKIETPSGDSTFIDITVATSTYHLSEVGTYKITAMVGEETKEMSFYSLFPADETDPIVQEEDLTILGDKEDSSLNGIFDNLAIFIIAMLVIFVGDWGVYCYEQHQLQ